MSAFARSPEGYAAWQQLKRNVALRVGVHPDDDDEQRAQRNRATQELHRLRVLSQNRTQKLSPTPERLERFSRVSEEVTHLAGQFILRTLERDHYRDLSIADLLEDIKNYRHMFDEHLRLVDCPPANVLALQKQIELEKRKRVCAENELRKATSARGRAWQVFKTWKPLNYVC